MKQTSHFGSAAKFSCSHRCLDNEENGDMCESGLINIRMLCHCKSFCVLSTDNPIFENSCSQSSPYIDITYVCVAGSELGEWWYSIVRINWNRTENTPNSEFIHLFNT